MEKSKMFQTVRNVQNIFCDMDGVLSHGDRLLPDVQDFFGWLKSGNTFFHILTNSSQKLRPNFRKKTRLGIMIGEEHF